MSEDVSTSPHIAVTLGELVALAGDRCLDTIEIHALVDVGYGPMPQPVNGASVTTYRNGDSIITLDAL